MKKCDYAILISVLLFAGQLSGAAEKTEEILRRAYHTEPHTLAGGVGFDKYNGEIIAIWEQAKKDKEAYVPALASLLNTDGMIPYFYLDGSLLLLSLDDRDEHFKLAASVAGRWDTRDVPGENYLRFTLDLSLRGHDVMEGAMRILENDNFHAFIVQHVLGLNQDYSFVYATSQMDPGLLVPVLSKRLEKQVSETALATIAVWAWHAATPEANQLLIKVADLLPKDERFDHLRARAERASPSPKLSEEVSKKLETHAQERKKRMSWISDEALSIYQHQTREMRTLLGDKP